MIEKIYKYTEEEESEIDRKFGYTPEQLDGLSYKHYQYSFGFSDIAGLHFWSFNRKCPNCGKAKLDWKNELEYIGLRRPGNATGGTDFRRAYEVTRILVCPECNSRFSLSDRKK